MNSARFSGLLILGGTTLLIASLTLGFWRSVPGGRAQRALSGVGLDSGGSLSSTASTPSVIPDREVIPGLFPMRHSRNQRG
jgi:hypothetical protein